jgi:hypothetical protein
MKKTLPIVLAAIILIALGTFIYLQRQQVPDHNISRLISSEAAFFVDVHDPVEFLEKMTEENQIWNELSGMQALAGFTDAITTIDSLMRKDKNLKRALEGKRFLISAEKQGRKRMGISFLLKLDQAKDQRQITRYLEKWGQSKNHTLKTRTYNKVRLYTITRENNELFSYASTKGAMIASASPLLVEQAIRQASVKNPMLNNPQFTKIRETAGKNVVANLFVNFNQLPELLALPLDASFKRYVEQLTNLGSWSALDVNIKKDAILLNGFSIDNPDKTEILDLFRQQEPVDLDIESILPSTTSTYISLGLSNKQMYHDKLMELYRHREQFDSYNQWKSKIESDYGFNPEVFYEMLHEEAGLAFLNANVENPREKAFMILKTKGQRMVQSRLNQISQKAVQQNNSQSHRSNLKIDQETSYTIYQLPVQNLFSRLFGSVFQGFSNQYFTLIDNYVVFAQSPELLKEFIYSNILNKTLNHNPHYQQFSDYLSDQSNFHFYTNMYRSPHLIANYLNENLKKGIHQNLPHFRKFQALAYQFMGSEDMCYNNLFIKYIPRVREEPKTVWETHLDTAIHFKPALVTNHYTDENEIFVQDLNNKIYLINNVGRILWEKQLEEKIMSEIHQIDYYKNGKLQMMFNTKNKLHLIARNGNYVERYPVSLPSPATAPMAIFDYENNRDYRIFIPCENKKVYDFSKEGDIIPGWEFGKSDTRVTKKVQHFRVNTRDYIVFADKYRVYILNRRGHVRVRLEEQFARSPNNLFVLEPKTNQNPPRLVTTDIKGTVRYIQFDGTVTSQKTGEYSTEHHFDYQDINSDGLKDLIFLDQQTLEVYGRDGDEIYSHEFESEISSAPIYFYFAYNDRKLGLVSREENKIYLFNSDGELYEGFPLKGSTPFSIGYLDDQGKDFHLIVGNKYNFLYNYNVIGK